MESDTQYTGRFKEEGPKTWELRDNVVMGCAGVNNYNFLFWRRLRDAFDKDYKKEITLPDRIDDGILAFNREIDRRSKSYRIKSDFLPQAVIAGFDEGLDDFVMFEVETPHPCVQVESHNSLRATPEQADTPQLCFSRPLKRSWQITA
jgi:hypothetical protein